MTPVLAIPVISEPDVLARCIASIDIDCRLLVIDNSGEGIAHGVIPDDAWLIEPPSNLGVAASWNLAIKCYPAEPWWLIANADTEFAPGDLSRLVTATESGEWGWVGIHGDWRVFGLTAGTVERIGWFDENFVPVFCEDADYERRCTLAGIPWGFIEGESSHVGSHSLKAHRADNGRTYPRNVEYYCEKWGVPGVRAPSGFTTPFDKGGPLSEWHLSLSRLREQAWR